MSNSHIKYHEILKLQMSGEKQRILLLFFEDLDKNSMVLTPILFCVFFREQNGQRKDKESERITSEKIAVL